MSDDETRPGAVTMVLTGEAEVIPGGQREPADTDGCDEPGDADGGGK